MLIDNFYAKKILHYNNYSVGVEGSREENDRKLLTIKELSCTFLAARWWKSICYSNQIPLDTFRNVMPL